MGPIYKVQCVALRTGPDSESNTAQHVCCKSNYYSPPLNSGADPQSPKAIMRLGEEGNESHAENEHEKKRETGQVVHSELFLVHASMSVSVALTFGVLRSLKFQCNPMAFH